ncbi:MAG: 50S ribosomal protein L10 [Pantoea sp. Brub]|nr:50S ribosomal protein L10 [Pantoea sp. Brub]
MPLNIQNKKEIVSKFYQISKNALSAVVADFRGITVDKITELRQQSRKSGVHVCVIRNTLLKRIVRNTQFECLKGTFIGPTLIAFSMEHPGIAARLFKNFAKDNITFRIKSAAFQNEIITAENIDILANLPTYEEALNKLIFTIKEAAIGKIIRVLAAIRDVKKTI